MSDDRTAEIVRVDSAWTLYVHHHSGITTLSAGDALSTAVRLEGRARSIAVVPGVLAIDTGLASVVPAPRRWEPAPDGTGTGHRSTTPAHLARAGRTDGEVDSRITDAVRRDAVLSRLAALAVAGDPAALGELLSAVRPTVVRYCRARMGGSGAGVHQAEDVTQNVLLAVYGALPRHRLGETRVMALVYGIASNKVADAFRAADRDHSDPTDDLPDTPDASVGPESTAIRNEQTTDLWKLLEVLPTRQREILIRRVAMGLTAEETALDLGSTAGAVRVTQHRALAKLRGLLADDRRTASPQFDL